MPRHRLRDLFKAAEHPSSGGGLGVDPTVYDDFDAMVAGTDSASTEFGKLAITLENTLSLDIWTPDNFGNGQWVLLASNVVANFGGEWYGDPNSNARIYRQSMFYGVVQDLAYLGGIQFGSVSPGTFAFVRSEGWFYWYPTWLGVDPGAPLHGWEKLPVPVP